MKELIESTKRLQEDIDRCVSRLVKARQYHDKIDEAGAVFNMERLLIASAQQLQCCIDKLRECGSVVEWQTGEPKRNGIYLVTTSVETVIIAWWNGTSWLINNQSLDIKYKAWCKLSDIEPYKNK